MHKRIAALALLAASALAACGGGASGGGFSPPSGGGGATATPNGTATPSPTATPTTQLAVGIALPTSGIGNEPDPTYGQVAGYTQNTYSQTLGAPVGAMMTLTNLSPTGTFHTFNVVSTTGFPANPAMSTGASGGSSIGAAYASGSINGGGTVQVSLDTAGTYFFGCAYHYLSAPQMRDVLNVGSSAAAGPQATPVPGAGGGGGGCVGIYC